MKVIINFGKGTIERGYHNVVAQFLDDRGNYRRQSSGSLPPAVQLAELYQQWQEGYNAFYQQRAMRIDLLQEEGLHYSETEFRQICDRIPQEFNTWLDSSCFAPIEKVLRSDLTEERPIKIVITSCELELQKLPWHLWTLLEDYPLAEITFSTTNWQKTPQKLVKSAKTRILSIVGSSGGLDLQQDLAAIVTLPETELTILTEPRLSELNEYLWQPEGWDILLFSGHSYSDRQTGYICLNETEKISIAQLKHSLQTAISLGLKIAIFNSCEGLGLARQLASLSIPYTVVMNEPIPDRIAQVFLQYFLLAFTNSKTFTLAVKEARQKLAGWETEFACASWLPTIWQNPAVEDISWHDFRLQPQSTANGERAKIALASSIIISSLVMAVRTLGWLEPLELLAYDRLLRQRPPETIDPRIVVVEITEEDTQRDRYPLADSTLIKTIELLNRYQPAAIGLDIHRPYQRGSATEYRQLIELFETNSHIFPVCSYIEGDHYAPPTGLSQQKLTQEMGFSDLLIDMPKPSPKKSAFGSNSRNFTQIQNLQVRRQLLSYDPNLAASSSKCLTSYSLSFQLAYEYLQQAGVEPLTVNSQQYWQLGNVVFEEMGKKFGGYQQLDGQSSQIAINYRSGKPGKRITLTQLQNGVEPQLIENRIVLIGYSAAVARDYFNTPYGTMPGVWIHAHQTSQIISAVADKRSSIWALPQWGDWLYITIWSGGWGIILVVLWRKQLIFSLLALGIVLLSADRFSLLILINGGWLPYIPLVVSLIGITIVVAIARENQKINTKILQ